jgi:hypothetical protein
VNATRIALEDLARCIRQDLAQADRHVAELEVWRTIPPAGHGAYAAALLLHHLYTAIEAILERALKVFDGTAPEGNHSHVQLLQQAARPVEGVRDAILPQDDVVRDLRRFRHRLRKRYDDELDPTLLDPLIKAALNAWPKIRAHLEKFAAFTEECAKIAR